MPRRHLHREHEERRDQGKSGLSRDLAAICTRTFLLTTLVNLLVMTAYYLVFVTGAIHVRETFDVSLSTAGLSSGLLVVGVLVGRFFAGSLVSRLGCPRILFVSLVCYALTLFATMRADALGALFALRFVMGFSVGFACTATATVVASAVPAAHRGLGISVFSLSTALALALGPFLGIGLSSFVSYETLLTVNLGMALACLAIFLFVRDWPSIMHHPRPVFRLDSYVDLRVAPFSCSAFMLGMGYGSVQAFMATHAGELGLTAAASLYFLVYGAATVASRPLTGRLFDRRGENWLLPPLFVITALSFLTLAWATSEVGLLASGLLLGLGFGNVQSVGQAVSLSMVTPSRFAQATSTYYMIFDFGIGVGPWLYGHLVPEVGFPGMYSALAATAIAGLVLYFVVHGRRLHFD